jgi:hypothetical protein
VDPEQLEEAGTCLRAITTHVSPTETIGEVKADRSTDRIVEYACSRSPRSPGRVFGYIDHLEILSATTFARRLAEQLLSPEDHAQLLRIGLDPLFSFPSPDSRPSAPVR